MLFRRIFLLFSCRLSQRTVHHFDYYCFGHFSELSDTIMNVVGAFLWVAVGATAIHYWQGYMATYDQVVVVREQVVINLYFFCLFLRSILPLMRLEFHFHWAKLLFHLLLTRSFIALPSTRIPFPSRSPRRSRRGNFTID